MEIRLVNGPCGLESALLGTGLSYGLTSPYENWESIPEEVKERLKKAAAKLASKSGGEDKFLRQIYYWWDINAPSYWWPQFDQYKIGVTTLSASKMHSLTARKFVPEDFELEDLSGRRKVIEPLNVLREQYLETKDKNIWMQILSHLPQAYKQRRVCSMNLAVMKNIYHQRKNHKLGGWHTVCDAFVEACPEWLRGSVFHE